MTEWRDMSSAPKDGTEVIAWGKFYGSYGYSDDEMGWTGVHWRAGRWIVTKPTTQYFRGFKPTYWLTTIPESPADD